MASTLLKTKVRIPAQPRNLVARGRLIDWLESRVPQARLTLVSAPAGYGKTTLLAEWARTSRLPVAWLSLSAEDDDFERFFRYMLAAWEAIDSGVRDSDLGVLLSGMSPETEAVLAAFVNAGHQAAGDIAFVLDDYHLIGNPAVHRALAYLLDHLPPRIYFVLAGRGEPPLPVARYRARAELAELRADDLSFSPEEAAAFLNEASGRALPAADAGRLHAQVEGWIAGLQLVAVALRRGVTAAAELAVGGRHRFIADYLSQEVLAALPAEMQQFLLQTSILDRLSGPLCDAVTGGAGGQEMLESLEREDLFLVPLDDGREWFRYHRLFGNFLENQLARRQPEKVAELHRRAAEWHLAHGLPEEAFRHARSAEDAELVTAVFRHHFFAKLLSGEVALLQRWMAALPEAWLRRRPELGLARAGVLFFTGQVEACGRCLDEIEQALAQEESAETRTHLARVTAIRCFIACGLNDLPRAEALAQEAIRQLPEEEEFGLRTGVYGALGDTYRQNARWQEAKEWYFKLLEVPTTRLSGISSVSAYGALADLELRQGRLRASADYWRQALAVIQQPENWGVFPLPVIGWLHIRLGEILYEWNDRPAAGEQLAKGLKRAELGGDVRALIAGYLLAGRLHLADGEVAAAEAYLERARPLVQNAQFAEWTARFERFQLELWLAQDRLRAAMHWVDERDAARERPGRPGHEAADLATARALLVKGDAPSVARALEQLAVLIEAAEAEGRAGILIEAGALQALGSWRLGDRPAAMTSLERALRLAEPEGYARLFVDLGRPLARLLQEARARNVMPAYVEELLAAAGVEPGSPGDAGAGLPEPLTAREEEVLALLAAGLTNREIAAALVISAETVKKHAGNIYGKLGVGNRTEAVARARELELLG